MSKIPVEIMDKIWIQLDFDTLKNTRAFQSEYIKRVTECDDMKTAAENNNLKNMKWIYQNGAILDSCVFTRAVQTGNLKMIKWLHANRCRHNQQTLTAAVDFGDITNIKYLINNGYEFGCAEFETACRWRRLDIIKVLHAVNCPFNSYVAVAAIKNGDLTNIKWLLDNGYSFGYREFKVAAFGSLDVVKLLHYYGCEWDTITFDNAARCGNLEMMKYLLKNDCPWTTDTFTDAVENGNLYNMKWLRANGCPWNRNTLKIAFKHNNYETMRWMLNAGFPN